MNNEFTMSLTSNFGGTSDKVGVTTTVKQQVDNIEMTIDHFKKCIETQRKQQNQIEAQLINLQQSTESNLKNMLNQVTLHSKQLIDTLRIGSSKQDKETEYLQLQKKIVEDQHQKLYQLSSALNERVAQMQQSVGI